MKPAIAPPQQKIQGFTLIELLVVIAVLGVLATGLLVLINPAGQMAKARDAGRRSSLAQIRRALEAYMTVNGSYPNPTVDPNGWTNSSSPTWLQDLINSGDIKVAPKDPRCDDPNAEFHYYYRANKSGGSDYCIMHALEAAPTTTDPNYRGYWNNTHKYFFGPDGTQSGYECTH